MRRSIVWAFLACVTLSAPVAAQDEDEIVHQAFLQAFGTTPAALPSTGLVRSPEVDAAIAAGRNAVASPSNRALQAEFADRVGSVVGSRGSVNIMEVLFLVLKESLSEMNEDKKYWLEKLAEMNKMSEELSDYLKELADASRELGEIERGPTGRTRSMRTVPITVRTFDPVWVEALTEPSGGERAMICDPCLTTRAASLGAEQIQREQESTLGLQRRLRAALQTAERRGAEIDRRRNDVVRMLAEVLRTVDQDREGEVGRTTSATS
ncbi:MAG TPA: hypothetical protein VJP59_10355 [Gemmatimonadota bacterium]|nr:hypothetical protein [Gemmatimonadota bacterium]